MKIGVCDIMTAFNCRTIGTKVTSSQEFWKVVERSVAQHKFPDNGQALINVPEAVEFVISGVGKRSQNPADYVCRLHRGQVHMFLRREFAEPVKRCAVVVYTFDAFNKDPQVSEKEKTLPIWLVEITKPWIGLLMRFEIWQPTLSTMIMNGLL